LDQKGQTVGFVNEPLYYNIWWFNLYERFELWI